FAAAVDGETAAYHDPASLPFPLFREYRLRHHGMHALGAVDHLGHVEVHGSRAQHVGVVARQALGGGDEIDHLADRDLGGLVEVLVETHGHVVGGGLGARPAGVHALVEHHLDFALERACNRRHAASAIALGVVAVAHRDV